MKTTGKRILSLLLCLVLVLSLLPTAVLAGDIANGMGWRLDDSGCLHLTGCIDNPSKYADNKAPWASHSGDILSVVAEKGASINNLHSAFANLKNLTTVDLRLLDISAVTDLGNTFAGCEKLVSANLSGWDTSQVTTMSCLFWDCSALTDLDISSFTTSNVSEMSGMFNSCASLTQLDLSRFDTHLVGSFRQMFFACQKLKTLNVSSFNTSAAYDMYGMFAHCYALESLDLSSFDTHRVEDMSIMFFRDTALKSIDLRGFDTDRLKTASKIIQDCTSLAAIGVRKELMPYLAVDMMAVNGYWADQADGTAYTSVEDLLRNITTPTMLVTLVDVELNSWWLDGAGRLHITGAVHNPSTNTADNTPWKAHKDSITSVVAEAGSSVDNCAFLFSNCTNLESVELKKLDTSKATSMAYMFGLSGIKALDLSGLDTANVTSMVGMLSVCTNLTTVNLEGFNTAKVTDFRSLFALSINLTSVNMGSFSVRSDANMENLFTICNKLAELTVSPGVLAKAADQLLAIRPTWYRQSDGSAYNTVAGLQAITGKVTLSALPFTDVKVGAWYYDAVGWAVDNGITNGTSSTKFSPNMTCTRSQIVTLLWRAAGEPTPKTTTCPFTDVKDTDYFYKAVLWAVENGITNGTSATTFSPKKDCTRGEIVTFLWRAKGEPKPSSTSHSFRDIKPNAYYYTAVLWAVEKGVTNGTSKTAFSPNESCTRAQAVTFLYRAFN